MSEMNLQLRNADESDLPELARMNKQLIEDEGHSNPMSVGELEERMRSWLLSDWHIDLLCRGENVTIGYAVYQYRNNPYDPDQVGVYLRQYFISRDHRRQGYGQAGIQLLQESRFKSCHTVLLDVLSNNHRGMSFWQKVGFSPYCTTMMLSAMDTD
jgi:ribosomal protein S18 acetylase RimI-like enzyme